MVPTPCTQNSGSGLQRPALAWAKAHHLPWTMLKILPGGWIGSGQPGLSDSEQAQAGGSSRRSGAPENSDPLPQSGIPPQQPDSSAARRPRLHVDVKASRPFVKVLEGAGPWGQCHLGPHAGSRKELAFTAGLFPGASDGGQ